MKAFDALKEFVCSEGYPQWIASLQGAKGDVKTIVSGDLIIEGYQYRFKSFYNGVAARSIDLVWWQGCQDMVVSKVVDRDFRCHKGFMRHLYRLVRGLRKLDIIPKR